MPAYGVRRPVVLSPFLLRVVSAVLAFLANAAARMAVVRPDARLETRRVARPDARLNCGPHPRGALAWAFEWVVVKTCVQGGRIGAAMVA